MNVCCNGKFSNRKLQENERKCWRQCDIAVRGLCDQDRPYNDDSTASRLLSEVKHHLARLVLRWGTTLESLVLIFCFLHPLSASRIEVVWRGKKKKLLPPEESNSGLRRYSPVYYHCTRWALIFTHNNAFLYIGHGNLLR